jgi:hypothetical protein
MKLSSTRHLVLSAVALGGLLSASTLAQEAPKPKGDDVVITGCVTVGSKPDDYLLSNPKAAGVPSAPTIADGTSSAPTAVGTQGKVMPYPLKGGDMKNHVGHTVTITGTLEDFKPSSSAHQMPGNTAAIATTVASSTLHVKSVKMIAPQCPKE